MTYYRPLKRAIDGRYDYTCTIDGHSYPVGYCGGQRALDVQEDELPEEVRSKFHETGHATPEEACECYKQYLIDTSLRFGTFSNQQFRCRVCEAWTETYAQMGPEVWPVCKEHSTKEAMETLFTARRDDLEIK